MGIWIGPGITLGKSGEYNANVDFFYIYVNISMYFRIVDEECYPYKAATDRCKIRNKDTLKTAGCTLPSQVDRDGMYRVAPAIVLKDETDIMLEIHESGPVQG